MTGSPARTAGQLDEQGDDAERRMLATRRRREPEPPIESKDHFDDAERHRKHTERSLRDPAHCKGQEVELELTT